MPRFTPFIQWLNARKPESSLADWFRSLQVALLSFGKRNTQPLKSSARRTGLGACK